MDCFKVTEGFLGQFGFEWAPKLYDYIYTEPTRLKGVAPAYLPGWVEEQKKQREVEVAIFLLAEGMIRWRRL